MKIQEIIRKHKTLEQQIVKLWTLRGLKVEKIKVTPLRNKIKWEVIAKFK